MLEQDVQPASGIISHPKSIQLKAKRTDHAISFHMLEQDVQPASRLLPPSAPTMPPADAHATITTSTKRTSVCQSATSKLTKDGKATIQFPDTSRALFGVGPGSAYSKMGHPAQCCALYTACCLHQQQLAT
eukprot:1158426-Pelagomonas_calceolata.AAC.13